MKKELNRAYIAWGLVSFFRGTFITLSGVWLVNREYKKPKV